VLGAAGLAWWLVIGSGTATVFGPAPAPVASRLSRLQKGHGMGSSAAKRPALTGLRTGKQQGQGAETGQSKTCARQLEASSRRELKGVAQSRSANVGCYPACPADGMLRSAAKFTAGSQRSRTGPLLRAVGFATATSTSRSLASQMGTARITQWRLPCNIGLNDLDRAGRGCARRGGPPCRQTFGQHHRRDGISHGHRGDENIFAGVIRAR